MHSHQLLSLILVAFTARISADVFNNYHNARVIQSTAFVPPNGRYVFSNAGNGEIIQHSRDQDVPNIFPAKFVFPRGRLGHRAKRPQLALRAHDVGTKWISLRTPLDGSDSTKCISAQWNDKTDGSKGGADHAGTLYECVVDPLDLAASLEKTKQWWLLMPVKAAHLLETSNSLSGKSRIVVPEDDDKEATDASDLGRELFVKHSQDDSTKDLPFWNTKTNRMEVLPRWKYDRRSLPETEDDDQVPEYENGPDDQSDKDGADATQELWSRSAHSHHRHEHEHGHGHGHAHAHASSSAKLGPFYVVSVDHLYDMETRVLSSKSKRTIGNQLSIVMNSLDPNDKTQQWFLELK